MKTIFRLGFFIFILSLYLFPAGELNAGPGLMPDNPKKTVSLDFQDVSLKDVLKVFSIQSGLNFIASEALQDRKITLYLDKVPLNKAMDELFKANNLSYVLDKDANIFMVKDWGKLQVETITRVFYLKHASVSSSALAREKTSSFETDTSSTGTTSGSSTSSSTTSSKSSSASGEGTSSSTTGESSGITQAVEKLLSSDGSVIEDFRTNSLIVTDSPNRMQVIAQVIASLDVPVPQVMLEVEMLDVNKNKIDRLGVKFIDVMTSSMFGAVLTGSKVSTGFPLSGGITSSYAFTKAFSPGNVDFSGTPLKVYFDFIKQQSDTKILARPRILTLNNETAEIKITTQEAIGTIQSQSGSTQPITTVSAERIETGISLRVTPQINLETGEITMFINPIVRDAAASTFNPSGYKDPEERSTKSLVRIKDGETVIVGGLIRNERSETITKLPLLGDIPLIGSLFRHKYKDKDRERELLVFITPHIIKDRDIKLAQTKKVNLPEREQDTASGVKRELSINTVLDKFEKKREK